MKYVLAALFAVSLSVSAAPVVVVQHPVLQAVEPCPFAFVKSGDVPNPFAFVKNWFGSLFSVEACPYAFVRSGIVVPNPFVWPQWFTDALKRLT